MAFSKENLLVRAALLMFAVSPFWLGTVNAEPRVDNVLVRMVPPGTTSLVGARMDLIKPTEFYKRMVAAQKLPQVDQFAQDTGFDPRRDVRELLFATTPQGTVLLGRGSFHVSQSTLKDASKTRHGQYDIWSSGTSGFCILDPTLAVAGEVPAVEAALDEWKSGAHTAAQPLLARVKSVNEQTQLWGVSTGAASFLADNLPATSFGLDFSKIFRGLDDTWFQADLTSGLRIEAHGTTTREQDAVSLRDAVKGLVGFGRLNVPENQPQLLRLWDGIVVEQIGRSITIRADIPQDLMDRLVQILGPGRPSTRI
jgi:hypothetical protein